MKKPRSLTKAVWIEEESYITQPFTIRHIYHFVESLNFLWLKLQYINDFPVVGLFVECKVDASNLASPLQPSL